MVSSSFIYKIDDKNLLHDIQSIYEYDIPLLSGGLIMRPNL